jgi:hypothetical protein
MQNYPNIPKGLPLEEMMKLASSAEGQALLSQLQQQHGKTMENAIAQAQAGDFTQVKQTMSEFLSSPAGQELMKQMRGLNHG